jgi:hypothetical protein
LLYEISKEIDALLQIREVPHRIVYGPERAASNSERIVIEHDRSGDSFDMTGITSNPKSFAVRWQGAIARIFAKDPISMARVQDHERRAEAVLDRLIVCIDRVRSTRKNNLRIASGAFVNPRDLEGSETWPGVVYELRFSIDRAVLDRKWDNSARPEGTLEGGLRNQTIVRLAEEDEEIACSNFP